LDEFHSPLFFIKTNEPLEDRALSLTTILADAIISGWAKKAEVCPSFAKPAWVVAWYIRDETYGKTGQAVNFAPPIRR
jgi:hypothetical protein